MHLVLDEQHSSSDYSNVFHPGTQGSSGYDEWAVPNGAPKDKPNGYPPNILIKQIVTLKAENLAGALKHALYFI